MASPRLILLLLLTGVFTLSTVLAKWHQNWAGNRTDKGSALAIAMGDSRRIFANHFFTKADVYFHSGYYPSIFDGPKKPERSHMEQSLAHPGEAGETEEHHEHDENCNHGADATDANDAAEEEHHVHDENCDHGEESSEHGGEGQFLNKPRDIIDAFGRNFYVTGHSHLAKGDEREMLPWLKIAAELDPQKVETYTVASYWLRTRLNKPKEAEQFLRDGLRINPDSYEILFEMGRIQREHNNDPEHARNLWELALSKWKKQEADGRKPNEFNHQQILGFLAVLEEEQGNYGKAIEYFEALKEISPATKEIEARILELKAAAQKAQ